MKIINALILAGMVAALLSCRPCPADPVRQLSPAPYKDARRCGLVSSPKLKEISGLAVSRRTSGLLWAINDSSNPPEIYALSIKGELLETYVVSNAANLDWEDLAGFRYRGEDFIIIADVGDNWAVRPFYTLYFIKEPDLDALSSSEIQLEWEMRFRFENSPLNCEAVAVDAANKKILLLSKASEGPVLYELPLDMPCRKLMYTARAAAKIKTIPGPTARDRKHRYGKYWSQPTAMDISANGNTLYILTYKHAYLFSRSPGQPWDPAFANPPQQISLPDPSRIMVQREALGLDRTTENIFVTSEKIPAPVYILESTE